MSTIQVLLRDRSYAIRVVPGGLAELGGALNKEAGSDRVVVLTSPRVARLHGETLEAGLREAGLEVTRIEVPDGERAKTLRTAGRVYDQLGDAQIERGAPLIALGGGSVCDLAGFVASTYLRGMPLILAPTTLHAQVDASVGDKNGLHHRSGRNRIGTFYHPQLAWVDPHLIETLPVEHVRSGMAEIIKVATVWDEEFFQWLEAKIAGLIASARDSIEEAITRAIQIRVELVGLDERSAGLRALLQFGERAATVVRRRHASLTPGEASAIGMCFAAELSVRRGWLDRAGADRLHALLRKVGLPTAPPDWSEQRDAYLRALADDKKNVQPLPEWVLLRAIGRAERTPIELQELFAEDQ